jgi:hypothetical protein
MEHQRLHNSHKVIFQPRTLYVNSIQDYSLCPALIRKKREKGGKREKRRWTYWSKESFQILVIDEPRYALPMGAGRPVAVANDWDILRIGSPYKRPRLMDGKQSS